MARFLSRDTSLAQLRQSLICVELPDSRIVRLRWRSVVSSGSCSAPQRKAFLATSERADLLPGRGASRFCSRMAVPGMRRRILRGSWRIVWSRAVGETERLSLECEDVLLGGFRWASASCSESETYRLSVGSRNVDQRLAGDTLLSCAADAAGGSLEMLQWARPNGCLWDDETCLSASEDEHLVSLRGAAYIGCA